MTSRGIIFRLAIVLALVAALVAVAPGAAAASSPTSQGNWWTVTPEPENPSSSYDSILYSEIAPKLREIEMNSNRVKVEVTGQSAGGRNLFLVTLSSPQAMGRLGQYKAISQTMLRDPAKAQEMIEKFGDFKVPVFINGSIHGNEYPGVDTAMRLIETLAYDDSPEVERFLDNVILLVNVCQNPDGRVMGTRANANGIDINRDFFTQSQPESRITAGIFADWNPMVVLDLHGFVNPMLIEPCTPPHNPNYEYDLYIKWALAEAEAMEAELLAQTGYSAQIPYRDFDLGWDDWPPSYAPMFAMYHGAYGHTLETPFRDERGVDAQYAACWGMLKFVSENRTEMIHDQIEIFRRGAGALSQEPVPPEYLPEWPQYPELMLQEFPAAYVIPAGEPMQISPHQPARLIDFLLYNDVQVEKASQAFSMGGVMYPAGTYVVWMDQPKRGLANVLLEDGLDLSDIPGLYFYSPPSVWSNPLLWGVRRAVMTEKIDVATHPITKAGVPRGSFEGGKAAAYAYLPTSNAAVRATNELLDQGVALSRVEESFADGGRDFPAGAIIVPADASLARRLANEYALDVSALKEAPDGLVSMRPQKVAVYNGADAGATEALKQLGFSYDMVSSSAINGGALDDYDVFINQGMRWNNLNADGRASFTDWYDAGGDYVGLAYRGRSVDFAVDAGITTVAYDYISGNNAIVGIDYDVTDPVAAGYPEQGYAFVNGPVWFTALDGLDVAASIADGDFLVAGFWPDWRTSGAAGMPIVVHGEDGASDLTLIGFDAVFRAHPEESFRLIANAIYNGLE
jgi:hypothetical protein